MSNGEGGPMKETWQNKMNSLGTWMLDSIITKANNSRQSLLNARLTFPLLVHRSLHIYLLNIATKGEPHRPLAQRSLLLCVGIHTHPPCTVITVITGRKQSKSYLLACEQVVLGSITTISTEKSRTTGAIPPLNHFPYHFPPPRLEK